MFAEKANFTVNTVNCVGVMGRGVALEFRKRYPKMYADYRRMCAEGSIAPGYIYTWFDLEDMFGDTPGIINVATKDDWRYPSKIGWIESILDRLSDLLADARSYVVVTMPALGCGNGGLDWNVVKPMIVEKLGHLEANIIVFEPAVVNLGPTGKSRGWNP